MVRERREGTGARLSIGALSRATGIPVETLRTWESRYGFPTPERKPSGHRLYPVDAVPRLRRIAEALARGHRAGQVVAAGDAELQELLGATAPPPASPAPVTTGPVDVEELLGRVERFEADALSAALHAIGARSAPLDFLEQTVAPLVRAVGSAWESGRLQVRHEHFLSERLSDLLRAMRLTHEQRARGPLVALTTLPGEQHALGLQMAALVLAGGRCRPCVLGTETPVGELASLARELSLDAVGISVSASSRGAKTASTLRVLRQRLPRRVALLTGGDGAPEPRSGIEAFHDLRGLDAWARSVA